MMSAVPTFYAFRAITPSGNTEECCKVQRLNYCNSLKINFDSIISLIDDEFDENKEGKQTIKVNFTSIRRTITHDVVTRDELKLAALF
ncbi:hypothetical protein TSAR_012923 [Trichomalopsis sarcophagae]|uniref:Uncharacterized protein n=1 Tax=Trichomalopsis sarcophagae TaxID=543379 RepID=A0A232EEH2_9HYME|nr:hypothetical protein TSAR_012923 [Trichomalopsis sarcophagae]